MIHIITVKDKNLEPIGILENAKEISVTRGVNEVWQASFSMPLKDTKIDLCNHFNYIDITGKTGRYYGLYRIMPTETMKEDGGETITYSCEHVLSTLLDDILFKYHQFTNYSTREVLEKLLAKQTVKRWKLGTVEFERFFHYSFENESGLLAPILSIPQPFDEQYEFTFDTLNYPWTLNLVKVDSAVKGEKRWGKDMQSFEEVSDPTEIVNKIYPLGSGEGVNQLDITSVNNNTPYLYDQESIDKWGEKRYVWKDLRFENAESLKASGKSLLNQWKDPKISFTTKSVDLSILPEYQHERNFLNSVIRIVVEDKNYEGRIIEEHIGDLSNEWDVEYTINNRLDDIATTQADLERKIAVNEAYSQGATNILAVPLQDNADQNNPLVLPCMIDDDVFNVNTCELTFRTKAFRAYSQATHGGGATVKSTSSGGATTQTTTSGGGTTQTTTSGGSTTATSSSGGGTSKSTNSGGGTTVSSMQTGEEGVAIAVEYTDSSGYHTHNIPMNFVRHTHDVPIPSHSHSFSTPDHTHSVSIPSHRHDVSIPAHSHSVTIPSHRHEIELPDHTHEIKHGIYELNTLPSSVTIKVDGNTVPHTSKSADRLDLVDYLEKDSSGKIVRGRHEIEILPNGLARIEADLIFRVFIRSHLGDQY